MSRPKLTYFDAPVSRPQTPFGGLPLLDLPGRPTLAQSNAILVYVGRGWGLHPKDDFDAARHEAMMQHVEDLRAALGPTLRIADEAEKKKAREALVANTLPTWAANAEKQIAPDGPFFGGPDLHVVDLKLHMVVRWIAGGKLDYVPPTVLAGFPRLNRVHDAVRDDARVKAWYAKR
jgi:glutathione S-transferase